VSGARDEERPLPDAWRSEHVANTFFGEVSAIKSNGLLSDEHFTVDGTLLEAGASHQSFKRKDTDRMPPDDPKYPTVNLHGQRRRNDTHQLTTNPDAAAARRRWPIWASADRESPRLHRRHRRVGFSGIEPGNVNFLTKNVRCARSPTHRPRTVRLPYRLVVGLVGARIIAAHGVHPHRLPAPSTFLSHPGNSSAASSVERPLLSDGFKSDAPSSSPSIS
jgi:hypothetical protein